MRCYHFVGSCGVFCKNGKFSGFKMYFILFCFVFVFSMPPKVIIIVIEFMFLGINIFWALLGAHFNPRLAARAKMSLTWAQNIFMPVNINCIDLLHLRCFRIL